MIGCVVDSVDTNSVQTQLLEFRDVSLAAIHVGDRVGDIGGATRLVVDATNVEAIIAGKESWGNVSVMLRGRGMGSCVPLPLTVTEVMELARFTVAAEATPAPKARAAIVEVRMMRELTVVLADRSLVWSSVSRQKW